MADFDLINPAHSGPLDVVLLVGGNGLGKSAILSALSSFFTAHYEGYGGERFHVGDVRQKASLACIEVPWLDQGDDVNPVNMSSVIKLGPKGDHSREAHDKYSWDRLESTETNTFTAVRDHDRWITGTRGVSELPKMFDPEMIADDLTL